MTEPAYLTIPEAYAALRISRATFYRLVKAGKIHPRNISPNRVLVPRSDVDAILSGGLAQDAHGGNTK